MCVRGIQSDTRPVVMESWIQRGGDGRKLLCCYVEDLHVVDVGGGHSCVKCSLKSHQGFTHHVVGKARLTEGQVSGRGGGVNTAPRDQKKRL